MCNCAKRITLPLEQSNSSKNKPSPLLEMLSDNPRQVHHDLPTERNEDLFVRVGVCVHLVFFFFPVFLPRARSAQPITIPSCWRACCNDRTWSVDWPVRASTDRCASVCCRWPPTTTTETTTKRRRECATSPVNWPRAATAPEPAICYN